MVFAFDCWSANGDIFRHSFGRGGFDEHEEFDTKVQCAQCHPPAADAPKQVPKQVAAKAWTRTVSFAKSKASQHPLADIVAKVAQAVPVVRVAAVLARTEDNFTKSQAPPISGGMGDLASSKAATSGPATSRYGPKNCVSTWRNSDGHCVVRTACQAVDIASYEFGLVCIDTKGIKTRHIFGRGSFDVAETFDTLAECSECIGLDDQRAVAFRVQRKHWQASEEASEVATLSAEVKTLTKGMTSMLGAVLKLRQKESEKVAAARMTTPSPEKVEAEKEADATLAAWSGEDVATASSPGASAAAPRLRSAAAAQRQPQSVAQVEDVRKKRHHRRRRIVEEEEENDDDEDGAEDTQDNSKGVQDAKSVKAVAQDSSKDDGWGTGQTAGIGEILSGGTDAEASELAVAADGEDSATALDDGSASFDSSW